MNEFTRAALLPERGVVGVGGADRVKFLQGLVTNDVHKLTTAHALYAGLLTPQGKLLYDFFLVDDGERILIEIAAVQAPDLVRRLTLYKLRATVEVEDLTPAFRVAALWGPEAAARAGLEPREGAAGRSPLAGAHYAFVDPRLARLGVRLLLPAGDPTALQERLTAQNLHTQTPAAYAQHRLSLAIPDTAEIGGETCYPLEANFEALRGVDFKKGCYVGQELTARMKLRGGLRKRVLPVHGASALPNPGTPVLADGKELGALIAAAGPQGLALLRLDRLDDARADQIRADQVGLSVDWPAWLPR